MWDFTLKAYLQYLSAIKTNYSHILRFDEYFLLESKPESFCLIRHDIDRKPQNAVKMAKLEYDIGVKSTYYFRAKLHTFKPAIIKAITELGHEIGYHYESLSDTNGDIPLALTDFDRNLEKFREIVPIRTISMHGRPFKKYDNRDIWRNQDNKGLLKEKFHLLGEVYLDIDYSDIAYISDTGRNWHTSKANLRDTTDTKIIINFDAGLELLNYLKNSPHPKMVFQTHPERWTDKKGEYTLQYIRDITINLCKALIRLSSKSGLKCK